MCLCRTNAYIYKRSCFDISLYTEEMVQTKPQRSNTETINGNALAKIVFHAARWSCKSIGQNVASCAMNGQSCIA